LLPLKFELTEILLAFFDFQSGIFHFLGSSGRLLKSRLHRLIIAIFLRQLNLFHAAARIGRQFLLQLTDAQLFQLRLQRGRDLALAQPIPRLDLKLRHQARPDKGQLRIGTGFGDRLDLFGLSRQGEEGDKSEGTDHGRLNSLKFKV
jgi:hypothetical protein